MQEVLCVQEAEGNILCTSPDLGFFKSKGRTHHVLPVQGPLFRVFLGVKLGETCHRIFTCKLVLFFVHTVYWGSQTPQKILSEDLVQGRKGLSVESR